ncbi:MAG: hypothetical protein MPN21_01885 [Thermoanaerobaculia bacterium]|nr:hypothetical protein [Thermoanaerobaculia bacterium]
MTNRNDNTNQSLEGRSSKVGLGLRIAVFNLAVFLIATELLCIGLYFFKTGHLFYSHPPRGRSVPTDIANVDHYRLHPYFGFQLEAHSGEWNGSFANNNHGFVSASDYPRIRRDGEVILGIFGGSVASFLAQYERDHQVIASQVAQALGAAIDDVVVLNFAQGGFKQPQQVQILSYFLATGQELDAVINVDGFNEVALGARNQLAGVAPSQPSVEHMFGLQAVTPLQSSKRRAAMQEARQAYNRYAELYNRAWSGDAPETRLAVGFLWHYLRYKIQYRRAMKLRQGLLATAEGETGSWLYLQPTRPGAVRTGNSVPDPDDVDWPPILDVWQQGAVTFAELARAAGAVSVHVLQPNQYFPTGRTFSQSEREVAVAEWSPYAELIPAGYELLAERAIGVSAEGIPIAILYDLFDDLEPQAYVDDCCHYTEAGNELLARSVAALLVQALDDVQKAPSDG